MAPKTEVYTWRLSPAVKARLEETARSRQRTVAQLLDEIVAEHLWGAEDDTPGDVERQDRLHAEASRYAGRLAGGDARRSENVRTLVRSRLRDRLNRAH